jgi:hypothetical protein
LDPSPISAGHRHLSQPYRFTAAIQVELDRDHSIFKQNELRYIINPA